jgi:hypothetical protein
MTDPYADHRCRRGERCARSERSDDGKTRVGGLIERERWLCEPCQTVTRQAVWLLPDDYARLAEIIGERQRSGGDLVAGSRELQVPINLGVEALMAAIHELLFAWAEPVAERARYRWDTTELGRAGAHVRVERAGWVLGHYFAALLNVDHHGYSTWDGDEEVFVEHDGVEGALLLAELHHRARRMLGETRAVVRLPETCHTCGTLALETVRGSELVDCANCGEQVTIEEHERRSGLGVVV